MYRVWIRSWLAAGLAIWVLSTAIGGENAAFGGENEGQELLDRATALQIQAQSLADLEEVVRLCEEALERGLDEGNREFAQQLLASSLYQYAARLTQPIFEQTPPDRRWRILRQFALRSLERVIEIDPEMADAQLLIAKLNGLPGGDRPRARAAADAAVNAFAGSPRLLAEALVVRAQLQEEIEQRLEDFGRAIKAHPGNVEAWQGRALTYLEQGDFDQAIADFESLLEKNRENVNARLALAETLFNLERMDEAQQQLERALEQDPENSLAYSLRARFHLFAEDAEAALADLDQALRFNPQDLNALMTRARVHLSQENLETAKRDIDQALVLSPGLIQAILIRSMIAAEQGRLEQAIRDIQLLLQEDPENSLWRLQLASYYIQDKRHSRAIDTLNRLLQDEPGNTMARHARADTLLTIGKHAEAIEDYEILVREDAENDAVLNNFAWVLATSPDDHLRDAPRARELATRACELTDYGKAHILSTLAAAYAELGDFETAIKWSAKAVELGSEDDETDEQLQQELDSYREQQPWRERQTVEEKEEPIQPPGRPFEA